MKYTYDHMEEFDGVIFPDFKQYDQNLILYGAGINGALCAFALKELGVEFLCFCDSDPEKQGTEYLGKPVLSPVECSRQFPGVPLLFDAYCAGKDMEHLAQLGYHSILFPAALFLNLDCEKAAMFITEQFGSGGDGYSFRESVDALQIFEWIDEYMIRGIGYENHRQDISRSINLDLTDKCTLRCKNCLALKPYFTNCEEMPWESMEQVIDKLTALNWFRRFHLLGGEPFLYPHLANVLEKLCANATVEHINIITNGTVIPNEAVMKSLQNPKIMVRISYYGHLSKNYKELENLCIQKGVCIRVHAQRWKDIGRALEHISSSEETKARYRECSQRAGAFFYVQHGRMTLCPFAANTHALGLYEADGEDIVDVAGSTSSEALFEQVTKLYRREKPLNACYYCNGWLPYATKPVPVAKQYAKGEQPSLPKSQDHTKGLG